jgi:hypothetical protein
MAQSDVVRKNLFGVNALSAWLGFGLSVFIELFGLVKPIQYDPPVPASQFGFIDRYAEGLAGAPLRLIDLLSYFTIWSQIVVAVVMTLLWQNPARDGKWIRIFRIDALLMITVTGVVYNLLLGPNYPPVGLNKISSPIEHTITPLLTVFIFFVAGPRGWFNKKAVAAALALPISYIFYTLIRGAIIGAYPYDFFDVTSYGYAYVITFVLGILAASLIVMSLYWAIDRRLTKKEAI